VSIQHSTIHPQTATAGSPWHGRQQAGRSRHSPPWSMPEEWPAMPSSPRPAAPMRVAGHLEPQEASPVWGMAGGVVGVVSALTGCVLLFHTRNAPSTPPLPLPCRKRGIIPCSCPCKDAAPALQAVSLLRPPSHPRPLTCAHRRMLPAPPATTLAGASRAMLLTPCAFAAVSAQSAHATPAHTCVVRVECSCFHATASPAVTRGMP